MSALEIETLLIVAVRLATGAKPAEALARLPARRVGLAGGEQR